MATAVRRSPALGPRELVRTPRRYARVVVGTVVLLLSASCGDAPRLVAVGPIAPRAWAFELRDGMPIVRSDDLGRSWGRVSDAGERARAVAFYDREVGWLVGAGEARLRRSTDGGESWHDQSGNVVEPPTDPWFLDAVATTSAARATAVGGISHPDQIGLLQSEPLILHTSDSGSTWRVARIAREGDLAGTGLSAICFMEGGAGIAVGLGASGALTVVSNDSGASWVDVTSRAAGFDVSCAGKSGLWVLTGGREKSVLLSADGGVTWTDRTGNLNDTIEGEITAFSFASPSDGWIAASDQRDGFRTRLYVTRDGGGSWLEQAIPAFREPNAISSIAFASADIGVAVGELIEEGGSRALTYSTTNAGRSWRADKASASVAGLRGLSVTVRGEGPGKRRSR